MAALIEKENLAERAGCSLNGLTDEAGRNRPYFYFNNHVTPSSGAFWSAEEVTALDASAAE